MPEAIYGVLSRDAGGASIAEMAELLRARASAAARQAERGGRGAAEGRLGRGDPHARSTTDREVLSGWWTRTWCTISSVDTGLALNALAENRPPWPRPHPGGHRHGLRRLPGGEPEKILLAYRSCPTWPCPAFTQIHAAPAGQEAEHQLQQFQCWTPSTPPAETGTVHAAGSALMHCDLPAWTRCGRRSCWAAAAPKTTALHRGPRGGRH